MLKLTYSFCRYSRLTCENINHNVTIVRQFTNLNCKSKTCLTWNSHQSLLSPIVYTGAQWRLLANIMKRFRLKKSFSNSNVSKTPNQMSESLQPNLTNISYGGKFEISEENDSSDEWQPQYGSYNSQPTSISTDFRIWEPVGKKTENNGFKFRVLSYNVLAQYLLECHPYLYTDCSSRNLKWKIRAGRLYDEILSISPDIFCLQEVQVSHLKSFYSKFEDLGYYSIFKQKTGDRQDGCAIYFKHSLFDIQDHISVEFYQPGMPILNRDNVGLMVKLVPKGSPKTPFVVATTHLLYNPQRTDVRLAQLQVLLAEIDRFAYIDNGNESSYLPIILTGDFNSNPDSAIVQLLDRGCISASTLRGSSDWKTIGVTDNCQHLSVYLNRQKGIITDFNMTKIYNSDYSIRVPEDDVSQTSDYSGMFNSGSICHPLKLTSVYHKIKSNGSLEATTFQDYWVTVDYIYFSRCRSLKLVERLRLPTATECEVLGRLPNDRYGSDHLALAATFELKPVLSLSSL